MLPTMLESTVYLISQIIFFRDMVNCSLLMEELFTCCPQKFRQNFRQNFVKILRVQNFTKTARIIIWFTNNHYKYLSVRNRLFHVTSLLHMIFLYTLNCLNAASFRCARWCLGVVNEHLRHWPTNRALAFCV